MTAMCAALNHVETEEWDDLRSLVREQGEKMDSLIGWRNMVLGGFSVITVVMGLVLYIFGEALEQQKKNQEAIIEMQRTFAVFQQEVKPYLVAGPRFTHSDYEVRSRADFLDMKEWVRAHVESELKEAKRTP